MMFRLDCDRRPLALLRTQAALVLASVLPLVGACSSTDDGEESTDSSAINIVLEDENNYQSTTNLDIGTIQAATTDFKICWDGVADDVQCHELEPARDIDYVAFLRFEGESQNEVRDMLASTRLSMSDVAAYFQHEANDEDTCAQLSSMDLYGAEIDVEEAYTEDDDRTYVVLAGKGDVPGVGMQTITFVEPSASGADEVALPRGCGILDFKADLSSAQTVKVPQDGPWIVGWRNLTRDGTGHDIDFDSIDSVLVGFYRGKTVGEIEENIFDYETLATTLWELELESGRSADLAAAKECSNGREKCDGAGFPGFASDDGVWLLGLMCSRCQNPAPVVAAILEPTSGG